MNTLDKFVDWLNNDVGDEGSLPNLEHRTYGDEMALSLKRHYVDDRQKGGVRVSNLGKPAVLLALAKLGYVEPEPKGKSRYIFHTGDMFENWLEIMLGTYGIKVISSQGKINHFGVNGHYDYLVEVDGNPVLVEAKTMSDNYSRMFHREQDDNRGYLTQLAMYRAGLYEQYGDIPAVWITINKGNSEISIIEPDYEMLDLALIRAENVVNRVSQVATLPDVLKLFKAPPGREEVYRKEPTGKLLMPTSMAYSPFSSAFYLLTDGINGYKKPTRYVDGYADVEHMTSELSRLVASNAVLLNA